MVRIVLTADETLMSSFRDIPLADFFGCSPYILALRLVYPFLDSKLPHVNGVMKEAPYSLRKVEAALLSSGYMRRDVVVAHPKYLHRFIGEDTKIVGISAMDPFGLGPVTMMFTYGGALESFSEHKFRDLVNEINSIRKKRGLRFKIVVGGQGAWQLVKKREEAERMGIDHVVMGETEHVIGDIFRSIESDNASWLIMARGFPRVEEIPPIVNPSYKGMVEVMRGCGRGCDFCLPNVRTARYMPIEKIMKEIEVNKGGGIRRAWVHSDDIFLYRLEDRRNFYPNREAVVDLFKNIMREVSDANPTHGSIAPVVADSKLLPELSNVLGAGPRHWIGIQPGIETASPYLISRHMRNKVKPFSPEEWPWVVLEGTYAFNSNYWFPAYTLVLGLPGETEEDAIETARLIYTMEKVYRKEVGDLARFVIASLAFVPMAALERDKGFNPAEFMTEARFLVIYWSWKTVITEVERSLGMFTSRSPLLKYVVEPIVRLGSQAVISRIRAFGRRQGFDPDKRLEPLEVKLKLIITA